MLKLFDWPRNNQFRHAAVFHFDASFRCNTSLSRARMDCKLSRFAGISARGASLRGRAKLYECLERHRDTVGFGISNSKTGVKDSTREKLAQPDGWASSGYSA